MKIVLQRVTHASVTVNSEQVSKIDTGYLLLVGIGKEDSEDTGAKLAKKICELRLYPNEEGKFDKSLSDVGGDILAVSQFTLYGKTEKGRRPDFFSAMEPQLVWVAILRSRSFHFCIACSVCVGTGR